MAEEEEWDTTKDVRNEMLKLMEHACLWEVTKELQGTQYYTIMADEITDASNKEQLTGYWT